MKSKNQSELKEKYKLIKQIIKEVIDQWDPIKLLPLAPQDEYNTEADIITATICVDMSEEDLAKKIQSIFIVRFSSDVFSNNLERVTKKLCKPPLSDKIKITEVLFVWQKRKRVY